MKRISIFLLLLVMLFLVSASADAETELSFQEKKSQARQLAEEMLSDSKIVVRLYNDLPDNSQVYKLLTVPLKGLSLSHTAVKEAYPAIDESTVIMIVGSDQRNEAVAAVIDDFIYIDTYDRKKSFDIWSSWSRITNQKYWTFTDALGVPIPQAKVEVLFCRLNYSTRQTDIKIHFDQQVFDKQGRLRPLILDNSAFRFEFIVSHPRYGKVIVDRYGQQIDGRFVLPLVSADSEAATRAVQGYVVDTQGNALEAMPVECSFFRAPGIDNPPRAYRGACGRAFTDEQGWFSVYIPTEKDGVLSTELIPPGARFHLSINPPKSYNLHEYRNPEVVVGSELMITMTAMNPDEYFHTFTFIDGQDIITNPEELQKINITLYRGSPRRLWRQLKYDDFKDGCDLPEGRLDAHTIRWNRHFSFKPIQLIAQSPEELVFKAGEQIIYEGTVVEGKTGKPMPDVLVLVKDSYRRDGFSELTDQQLQSLRARAISSYNEVPSGKALYECDDRVTLTDENGRYQFIFKTGLSEHLDYFVALEKGYVAEEPVSGRPHRLTADRIIELPAIKLLPSVYRPAFVFEDEFGNIITDPNIFEHIRFEIERDDGNRWGTSYRNLININRLTRGTYYATLDWQDMHYDYEPVKVAWDRPGQIVFKVKEVKPPQIIYQSQVIHGITGAPMPGAIVMDIGRMYRFGGSSSSGIQPEQWDAVHSLGPEPDPDDPAIMPLRQTFKFDKITRTDKDGKFQLALEFQGPAQRDELTAIEEDYLSAHQPILRFVPGDRRTGPHTTNDERFKPDADGYVTLPTMKLYPSATVAIEPNLPGLGGVKDKIRLYARPSPDDPAPWLKDSIFVKTMHTVHLRPNGFQTACVPAGFELTLEIHPMVSKYASAIIGGFKFEQGEFLDVGRVDFQPTFQVTVKVVDSAGLPVEGVHVRGRDKRGFYLNVGPPRMFSTDKNGKAALCVPPHSSGEIYVFSFDRQTREKFEESTPYKVTGEEDTGRVFTLQLSDEIVRHLSENNLLRP